MTLMAMKAANDPHLFPYPLKEEWWAVVMAKMPDTYGSPVSRYYVNQGLKQQHTRLTYH